MTDNPTFAFLEGAAAAIANHGVGRGSNTYLQQFANVKRCVEPTNGLILKFAGCIGDGSGGCRRNRVPPAALGFLPQRDSHIVGLYCDPKFCEIRL